MSTIIAASKDEGQETSKSGGSPSLLVRTKDTQKGLEHEDQDSTKVLLSSTKVPTFAVHIIHTRQAKRQEWRGRDPSPPCSPTLCGWSSVANMVLEEQLGALSEGVALLDEASILPYRIQNWLAARQVGKGTHARTYVEPGGGPSGSSFCLYVCTVRTGYSMYILTVSRNVRKYLY